ncbi:hypothetical protein, partial [uncultured Dysosmobacter sp.]|uniref:hypothetical protein n=1 Tax=uncultured Dysosmobacter sp. TaxID=2591384 RepID=UPI00261AF177
NWRFSSGRNWLFSPGRKWLISPDSNSVKDFSKNFHNPVDLFYQFIDLKARFIKKYEAFLSGFNNYQDWIGDSTDDGSCWVTLHIVS